MARDSGDYGAWSRGNRLKGQQVAIPEAGVRARDTALVVEIIGWLQIIAGLVSGIVVILDSREQGCVSLSEVIPDKCYKFGAVWDLASIGGGAALIVGGVSAGSLFVMVSAYVRHQLRNLSVE